MPAGRPISIIVHGMQSPGSVEYRRRARQLRHRLRHAPSRLHQSLRELAHELQSAAHQPPGVIEMTSVRRTRRGGNVGFPLTPVARAALGGDRSIADAFAARIAESLEGGVLRYSRRASLLRQAERMGIRRFEANLIIATLQHRSAAQTPPPREPSAAWIAPVAMFLATQLLILAAAWRLFAL